MAIPFTNKAQLIYKGTVRDSNTVSGEIMDSLIVTKGSLSASYTEGDKITYYISIKNNTRQYFADTNVVDDLGRFEYDEGEFAVPLEFVEGSARRFINGTLVNPAPYVPQTTEPLFFEGVDIPAGGNVLLLYEARVTNSAPLGRADGIKNTVTVSDGGLVEPVSNSLEIPFDSEAQLSIIKTLNPRFVEDNGYVTYEFTIENRGANPVIADDGAIVEDMFDPMLSDIVVVFNGTAWTEGTQYTYTSGLFRTTEGSIIVDAATYTLNEDGTTTVIPGKSVLTVRGRI